MGLTSIMSLFLLTASTTFGSAFWSASSTRILRYMSCLTANGGGGETATIN